MEVLRGLLLAGALLLVAGASSGAVSEGDEAPVVDLESLDGRVVDPQALRGRIVVVDFWATWCAPCVKQLRALDALQKSEAAKNAVIVAVSIDDDAEAARRFLRDKVPGASLRAAHDPGAAALSSFGAEGIPALFVLDRQGVIRHRHFGPGGVDGLARRLAALGAAP